MAKKLNLALEDDSSMSMPNQSSEEDRKKKEQRKEKEKITKIAIERISSKETDPEEALRMKKEKEPEV